MLSPGGRGSCRRMFLYPLIVETFGFWTPASLAILRIIASKTMTKTRLSFSRAFSNLLEQLSVRLWQSNARILNDIYIYILYIYIYRYI